MKSPLLLSAHLPDLVPALLEIINNTEIIAINQDIAGVQARKLAIDDDPLPWLVGLAPCDLAPKRSFSRGLEGRPLYQDNREWAMSETNASGHYIITSLSTGRCLSAAGSGAPVLLPCNVSKPEQVWAFGRGIGSPTSLYSVQSGLALAVDEATLYSTTSRYKGGHDQFPTPSAAYGQTILKMEPRQDQKGCSRRGCENYDDKQMWFYDPVDSLLRQSSYTASLNHPMNGGSGQSGGGNGYLTPRTPTYQHHCLAHVLSNMDEGTANGSTEVWGGPLAGGDFVRPRCRPLCLESLRPFCSQSGLV